jgi:hypothetical protein
MLGRGYGITLLKVDGRGEQDKHHDDQTCIQKLALLFCLKHFGQQSI